MYLYIIYIIERERERRYVFNNAISPKQYIMYDVIIVAYKK